MIVCFLHVTSSSFTEAHCFSCWFWDCLIHAVISSIFHASQMLFNLIVTSEFSLVSHNPIPHFLAVVATCMNFFFYGCADLRTYFLESNGVFLFFCEQVLRLSSAPVTNNTHLTGLGCWGKFWDVSSFLHSWIWACCLSYRKGFGVFQSWESTGMV